MNQQEQVICTVVYKPPNQPVDKWTELEEYLSNLLSAPLTKHIIIGDFNDDLLKANPKPKIKAIFEGLNLCQHIKEATRITENTETLLDLAATNIENYILKSGTFPKHISDHSAVYLIVNWKQNIIKKTKVKIWKYKDGDYTKMKRLYRKQIGMKL